MIQVVISILLVLPGFLPVQSQTSTGTKGGELEKTGEGLLRLHYTISDYLGKKLVINGRDIGVFVNNQLVDLVDQDTLYLDRLGSGKVLLVLSSENSIEYSLMDSAAAKDQEWKGSRRYLQNYFSFSSVFFSMALIFMAVIKWTQGRDLYEYLRISRMFSPRNTDENILRNKLFTTSTLLYILFFNLTVSGAMVCYENLAISAMPRTGELFFSWLIYFGLFGVFLVGKWLLISLMNYIFNFTAYLQPHVINYLRISSFFALIWALVLLAYTWWAPLAFPAEAFKLAVFFSALIRISVLFLKLNSTEGYRVFHLFSYLCATEIIPFFGVVYFTSGFF